MKSDQERVDIFIDKLKKSFRTFRENTGFEPKTLYLGKSEMEDLWLCGIIPYKQKMETEKSELSKEIFRYTCKELVSYNIIEVNEPYFFMFDSPEVHSIMHHKVSGT